MFIATIMLLLKHYNESETIDLKQEKGAYQGAVYHRP